MKTIKVTKGQMPERSGELNSKVFTAEPCLLRSYTVDDKGKEHIFMFGSENCKIADNCEANIQGDFNTDAIITSIVAEKNFSKLHSEVNSYRLDLISSPKDYVEILDGIIPIGKYFGLNTGIIGIIRKMSCSFAKKNHYDNEFFSPSTRSTF